jgi:hypothetical protein
MTDRDIPGKAPAERALFPFPNESPVVLFTKPETRAALGYDYDAQTSILRINDDKFFVHQVRRMGDQDMVLVLNPNGEGYAGFVTKPDEMGETEAIQYLRALQSLICPQNRVHPVGLDQKLRQLGGFDRNHKQEVVRRAGVLGLTVIKGSGN